MSTPPRRRGFFSRLLGALDLFRRLVVNLVFLLILAFFFVAISEDAGPLVPEKAVLVFAPQGNLVEQLDGDAVERALARLTDSEVPQVLVWDVLDALKAAQSDDRIQALVMDLDGLGGAGLPLLQEVHAAIDQFRESGKPVYASGDIYSRNGYHLATAADEIHLHEMGAVILPGYGRYRTYYKEGMDKLGVDWHIYRHGDYKSGPEPYLRDDMSEAAERANKEFIGDLWRAWLADIEAARPDLNADVVAGAMDNLVQGLEASGGDTAQAALAVGFVDELGQRDTLRQRLIDLVGQDEEHLSYRQIGVSDYVTSLGPEKRTGQQDLTGGGVAVVVASGTILDGSQPPGTIGGDSTARLIRRARQNDDAKAVVLRVDSGGGSSFASEVIRRELELTREAGKPVVVSMGSVAASGGYWIATSSDEIWASPVTITGSIGIYATIPTIDRPLRDYLGVRVDGVETNWLAGVRLDRPWPQKAHEVMTLVLRDGYDDFLERVAEARGMTVEEVHEVAQGRVWSGEDAHSEGLVDSLGTFLDAVASAGRLADLGEDFPVRFIEKELDFGDQILLEMMSGAETMLDLGAERRLRPGSIQLVEQLARQVVDLDEIAGFGDPRNLDAYCYCEVE